MAGTRERVAFRFSTATSSTSSRGAIEREPGDPWHWWSRAWAYDEVGLYGAAEADFEELLSLINLRKYLKHFQD